MSQSAERSLIRPSDNCSLGDVYILLFYIIDMLDLQNVLSTADNF